MWFLERGFVDFASNFPPSARSQLRSTDNFNCQSREGSMLTFDSTRIRMYPDVQGNLPSSHRQLVNRETVSVHRDRVIPMNFNDNDMGFATICHYLPCFCWFSILSSCLLLAQCFTRQTFSMATSRITVSIEQFRT